MVAIFPINEPNPKHLALISTGNISLVITYAILKLKDRDPLKIIKE